MMAQSLPREPSSPKTFHLMRLLLEYRGVSSSYGSPRRRSRESRHWWQYAAWDLVGARVDDPLAFSDAVEEKVAAGMSPYTPEKICLSQLFPDEA